MRALLILVLSFNALALDFSSWDLGIDIPEKVRRVAKIKNINSTDYQILAFEAAIDLKNIAKSNLYFGNTLKALYYLSLANSLFSYRDDLRHFYHSTLDVFVVQTSTKMKKKDIKCDDLKERVLFLKRFSKKHFDKLPKSSHCKSSLMGQSFNADVKIEDWIRRKILKFSDKENLYLKAQTDQQYLNLLKEEENKTHSFPKQGFLAHVFKVLGDIEINADLKTQTAENGQIFIRGHYDIDRKGHLFSYEGLCRYLSNTTSSWKYSKKVFEVKCGYAPSKYSRKEYKYFYGPDWDFTEAKVYVPNSLQKYFSDNPRAKRMFFRFLPRYLDMQIIWEYSDKVVKTPFKIEVNNIADFLDWIYINDPDIEGPKVKVDKTFISFLNRRRFAINSQGQLKGLSKIKIVFDKEKTFNRLKF